MFGLSMVLARVRRLGKPTPVQASYGFPGESPGSLKPESAAETGYSKARVKQLSDH